MNFSERIKTYVQNIVRRPAEYQRRLDRFLRFQFYFWPMAGRRLWRHNPMQVSAALSYQTIFALIPVLVLTVLFLKAFGVVEDSKSNLRVFLNNTGVSQIYVMTEIEPETQPSQAVRTTPTSTTNRVTLSDKIEEIYDRVESKITLGSLGPVSILLLIWTALSLLTTIEQSLNRIFGSGEDRPIVRRLILYWSAITISPLLFVAAGYVSRIALAESEKMFGVSWLMLKVSSWIWPILIGVLLIAMLYKYLPNTAISSRTAVLGALVASPLWFAAKWGFGLYVSHAATSSFYGAAGVIPVFLFWLYISWLIFLLGAEIAYTAANLSRLRLAEEDESILLGPADLLAGTIIVTRAFISGQAPIHLEEIQQHIRLPDFTLHRLLDRLIQIHIVAAVQTDEPFPAYTLARPANQIALPDVLEITKLSNSPILPPEYYDEDITALIEKVLAHLQQSVGNMTLEKILAAQESKTL
jgi:membrane protein